MKKSIHLGQEIPPPANLLMGWRAKAVVGFINALSRIKIKVPGGFAKIALSDKGGLLIDLTQTVREGESAGGTNLKGEWSSTYTNAAGEAGYSYLDEATISSDPIDASRSVRAGTYRSLVDNNTTEPWNSETWMQVANNNAVGFWQ